MTSNHERPHGAAPMSELAPTAPHAYAVETLWNRGSQSERWGLAMELEDVRQPLDRDDAEQLIEEMIAGGHSRDGVRLVAIVANASPDHAVNMETIRLLNARLAAVEAVLDAMGDPRDPKHLHPQAAGLLVQVRDALSGTARPNRRDSD